MSLRQARQPDRGFVGLMRNASSAKTFDACDALNLQTFPICSVLTLRERPGCGRRNFAKRGQRIGGSWSEPTLVPVPNGARATRPYP